MTHPSIQNNFSVAPVEAHKYRYDATNTLNLVPRDEFAARNRTSKKERRNTDKSGFAIAIAQSYFIPGITARARCLDGSIVASSNRDVQKISTKSGSKIQRRAYTKRSASVSSFSTSNSWDVQRHSSGSWCPEDSRSIRANPFSLGQCRTLDLATQETKREKCSSKIATHNCSQTTLGDHLELCDLANRDARGDGSSVYCQEDEQDHWNDQASNGSFSISQKIESLQQELYDVRALLQIQKDRKIMMRLMEKGMPALPSKRTSSCSRLSRFTGGNSPILAWSRSTSHLGCELSLSLLASPHRATVSSRTLGELTRRGKLPVRSTCSRNDIDSASPLSGLQAVTLSDS